MRWHRFVAVGDSFTEGLDDPYPTGATYRGWADLVAGALAGAAGLTGSESGPAGSGPDGTSAGQPPFTYANLAVRGRLFDRVVDEQLPPALGMRPDLVSFAAGGNDVLRRGFDPDALVRRFDDTVARLRGQGADVILFRFADVTARLPAKRLLTPRVEVLNRAVGETARRHGATLVDLWADREFVNPALWSTDRLHLSAAGHRRVAAHVLTALGLTPDPEWWRPPPRAAQRWLTARAADVVWVGRHLAPWVKRRVTGRSSGDEVTAKRPEPAPVVVP